MNKADEADQLIPGLAMRVSVFAGINGGKLPLIFSGKRLDGMVKLARAIPARRVGL